MSRRLTENGHFEEARIFIVKVRLLTVQAAAMQPHSSVIFEELARVSYIFGNFQECIDANSKAMQLSSGSADKNMSDIGLCYYRMDNCTEAQVILEQAIQQNPRNSAAVTNLGLVFKKMGNFKKAEQSFKEALMINQKESRAFTNLGLIYYESDKLEQSALSYLKALEIEPNDEETLCNLGMTLSKIRFNDYAKIAFEEAINVNPGHKVVLVNYLLFLLENKQFNRFANILTHASRILEPAEFQTY